MPEPREYFADRIDCSHSGKAVILSGELVADGDASLSIRRFSCSHQRQCSTPGCGLVGGLPDPASYETVLAAIQKWMNS